MTDQSEAVREQKIAQIERKFEEETEGMLAGIAQAKQNKANLILGRKIDTSVDISPETVNGKVNVRVGLNEIDFKRFVTDPNEKILSGESAIDKFTKRLNLQRLKGNARKIFSNLKEQVKKPKEEEISEEEIDDSKEPTVEESDASAGVEVPTGPTEEAGSDETSEPTSDVQEDEVQIPSEQDQDLIDTLDNTISDANKKLERNRKVLASGKGTAAQKTQLAEANEAIKKDIDKFEKQKQSVLKKAKKPKKNTDSNISEQAGNTLRKAKLTDDTIHPDLVSRIADKLEAGTKLSPKEQKLYDKFKDTINNSKEEAPGKAAQFQDYVVNKFGKDVEQAKKKAKKVTDKVLDSKAAKRAKKVFADIKQTVNGKIEEVFGEDTAPAEEDNELLDDAIDTVKKGSEQIQEGAEKLSQKAKEIYEATMNGVPVDLENSIGPLKYGPNEVDIMRSVNERMTTLFPKMKHRPRVVVLDDLTKAIGIEGVGYSIGATVYIEKDEWNQGTTFMHEMAHVFFKMSRFEPQTQEMLQSVMQKKALIDKIKTIYGDYIKL